MAKGRNSLARSAIARLVLLQVLVEILKAGALSGLGVVARQGVVKGCPPLGAEPLSHHDLNEASEAADALEELLRVALVDDEGVHALPRHTWGEDSPARCAGHVRVLALRVDHVGGDAARQAAEARRAWSRSDLPEPERARTAVLALRCVPSQGS